MKITVLWEDQRGVTVKGFGPHELLLFCLEDRTGRDRNELRRVVIGVPEKGVGKVIRALKRDLRRLADRGPVFAIVDRDKVRRHVPGDPPDCMSGIRDALEAAVEGPYELVFLVKNMESVIDACCKVLGNPTPEEKPTPDRRDLILKKAFASGSRRRSIQEECPSFGRLVEKVASRLAPPASC